MKHLALATLLLASAPLCPAAAPAAPAAPASPLADSAWDYFRLGELHAPQPIWHPESRILSSSGLGRNEAGYPVYIESLTHISPDGMTLTHRTREYFIGQAGVCNDTTRVQHAVAPYVFMDTLHSSVPQEEERVDLEIWDIDPATNRLKSITSKLYNFRDPSRCEEHTRWAEPAPLTQDELANANADNGFFIRSGTEGGCFLHRRHPDLYTAPGGKYMVQAISAANWDAAYEFIVYEKQEDGTWLELPTTPSIFTDRAALDFSLGAQGITAVIIDDEYAQALTVFIPYRGADTRLGYRTSYDPREQQAGTVKVEFLAVHPQSDAIIEQMRERRPRASKGEPDAAQVNLSGYQILPYPQVDDRTGQPLLDKQRRPVIRFMVVQSPQDAEQQGTYISSADVATAAPDPARPGHLNLTLTPAAAQRMTRLTGSMPHGSSRLAIVINGLVRCAPIVHGTLSTDFTITGLTAPGEPESIATALTKDAIPGDLRANDAAAMQGILEMQAARLEEGIHRGEAAPGESLADLTEQLRKVYLEQLEHATTLGDTATQQTIRTKLNSLPHPIKTPTTSLPSPAATENPAEK